MMAVLKTGIKSIHAADNLMRRMSNFEVKNELLVLPSMIEETEEPVQIHVGRTFQKVLLQHVLEVVDSFIRILQKLSRGSGESPICQWRIGGWI